MPTKYYVIRTDDDSKEWFWHEAQEGRLRQGWGRSNMALPSGEHSPDKMQEWVTRFRQSAQECWHEEISKEQAERRYWILHPMMEIRKDDIIVIPKMPTWGSFCIAKATDSYRFDTSERKDPEDDDFRHVIPIELTKKSIPYRANTDAQNLATSFRAYQKAVNIVRSRSIIDSIQRLLKSKDVERDQAIANLIAPVEEEAFTRVAEDLMTKLTRLQPDAFEEVIEDMVKRNGYQILKKNHFNRKGGDVDIVAEPNLPPLADAFDQRAPLLLQIKKKNGVDQDDVKAVGQLSEMSQTYPGATMVVISSAERFTPECEVLAKEKGVQLISQGVLARLLLRYSNILV